MIGLVALAAVMLAKFIFPKIPIASGLVKYL